MKYDRFVLKPRFDLGKLISSHAKKIDKNQKNKTSINLSSRYSDKYL